MNQRFSYYSQKLDQNYSEEQKVKILQVMNESDVGELSRYDITKSRVKYVKQWRNNNGSLKCLSDIDMVEGFSDKYAKKLFDSILSGYNDKEEIENIGNKKIKGQILHPLLAESVRKSCETVLTIDISANCICWMLIDRRHYEVLEWKYYGIVYPEGKRFQITDIFNIAWKVSQALPPADIYVTKAEATTLRAAGSDPNNPKILAINLQRAQMVAMIVALINARQHDESPDESTDLPKDKAENSDSLRQKVYFMRPSLAYRLYGTLVGSERVSTDQTVEILLQEKTERSTEPTRVFISEEIKTEFRNKNELERDMLGHCFLLGITFMDLCIYKRKEVIKKLVR